MQEKTLERYEIVKKCIEEIEKLPVRVGACVYVRIGKGGKFHMLSLESKELYEFMVRRLFQKGMIVDKGNWKLAVDYVLGDYTIERMKQQKIRIGNEGKKIYYDILDINSKIQHYVSISKNGWEVIEGNLDNYEWNNFQMNQVLPVKGEGDIWRLLKYINLEEDDELMFLVYLIYCFVPDLQHPILNICGEAGTGKSTISRIIKDLVDPSNAPLNDFSDGEDGIKLPLSQNYLTVFDNVERLPQKLNALFCRAVTGGEIIKRKLYSNMDTIAIALKSIVVMNGITSAIRREDLMSRTVFIQTKSMGKCNKAGELWEEYQQNKKYILAGIFDVLVDAMKLVDKIELMESYRMMEFAAWGYAIAEALGAGNGIRFLKLLKKNEHTQLQETYANEPLIVLISKYMMLRHGEDVCMLTSAFYEKIMKDADIYLGSGSIESKKLLPRTPQTFTKKVNSLKSVFRKMGIIIEIDRTHDVRNLSQILISMVDVENLEENQKDVKGIVKEIINREPIVGIRKPITLDTILI